MIQKKPEFRTTGFFSFLCFLWLLNIVIWEIKSKFQNDIKKSTLYNKGTYLYKVCIGFVFSSSFFFSSFGGFYE
jgi:hypothetical protein